MKVSNTFELFKIVSKMNKIFDLNIDSLLLKEVNGKEFRCCVVLSYLLGVLTTWASIARLNILLCVG